MEGNVNKMAAVSSAETKSEEKQSDDKQTKALYFGVSTSRCKYIKLSSLN